ncbi:hypothetical protein ACFL6S_32635 [Candidatus Poribacteria bacterium]
MLSEKYPIDRLREIFVPREAWHPYPTRDEREAWERIPEDRTLRRAMHVSGFAGSRFGQPCFWRWPKREVAPFTEDIARGINTFANYH